MSQKNQFSLFFAVLAAVVVSATSSHATVLFGGSTDGELFTISQTDASGVVIGTATNNNLSGIAFRSDRRLFGSTVAGSSNPSTLIEIDPATGQSLGTIGTITDIDGGAELKISDLSFQPGTDILYGITAGNAPNNVGGTLYTIDAETAEATLVGQTCTNQNSGAAIAFGPDGTLYLTGRVSGGPLGAGTEGGNIGILAIIDPTDGLCLSSVQTFGFFDGLAVRPEDGVLFATEGDDSPIVKLDPTTGAVTLVGESVRDAGDLDFVVVEQELVNISSRARVGTGENVMIAGFITRSEENGTVGRPGGGPTLNLPPGKRLLIRGIGPSLTVQGAPLPERLEDPVLELYDGNGALLQVNDNWKDTQQSEIEATGIAPTQDAEAAMLVMLAADARFTTILRGKNNTTGIGLVEVYDLDNVFGSSTHIVNISTRAFVSTGDNVLIGGTIVGGSDPANFVIRGLGPSLTAAGIVGALQDPTLELYDANANLLDSNDNWQNSPDLGAAVLGSGLAPTDPREAALFVTPDAPGPFTTVVRGKNGTTGVGMVEAYRLSTMVNRPTSN